MTVGDLVNELQKFDADLPVCIDDNMGFVEANEKTIDVEYKKYRCFPFTKSDEFMYVNLTGQKE